MSTPKQIPFRSRQLKITSQSEDILTGTIALFGEQELTILRSPNYIQGGKNGSGIYLREWVVKQKLREGLQPISVNALKEKGEEDHSKLITKKTETALTPVSEVKPQERSQAIGSKLIKIKSKGPRMPVIDLTPNQKVSKEAVESLKKEIQTTVRKEVQAFKAAVQEVAWRETKAYGQQLLLELAGLVFHWPERWDLKKWSLHFSDFTQQSEKSVGLNDSSLKGN
ncbi:MAG: hypothetical protein ACE5OZ_24240 [Candidatus Heimdallarchaeota archaeon]